MAEAARRGARKVTLRVLGTNAVARRLYARCGFVEEGVLRDEFVLDGRFVDDVFMARFLETELRRHEHAFPPQHHGLRALRARDLVAHGPRFGQLRIDAAPETAPPTGFHAPTVNHSTVIFA